MKATITPKQIENIFPALRRLNPTAASLKDGEECVVLFTDKSRGIYLVHTIYPDIVGTVSDSLRSIDEYGAWLPCTLTLAS
jgi:hypothetical protein